MKNFEFQKGATRLSRLSFGCGSCKEGSCSDCSWYLAQPVEVLMEEGEVMKFCESCKKHLSVLEGGECRPSLSTRITLCPSCSWKLAQPAEVLMEDMSPNLDGLRKRVEQLVSFKETSKLRIRELLEANTAEVGRRRDVEQKVRDVEAERDGLLLLVRSMKTGGQV